MRAQEAARRSISAAGLPAAIERQAAAAVEEADALILVVDGQVMLQSKMCCCMSAQPSRTGRGLQNATVWV